MDSLTQVVLGATVGEAVLGRKAGRKALLCGAIAGTLPDLDVLAYPFWNDVERLTFHRGMSHSLLVLPFLAALCAWLVHRWQPKISFTDWYKLWFVGLMTHPLLDLFTTYGTQVFWPITDFPYAFNILFIIDPLYTLPLLTATLVLALRGPNWPYRHRVALVALSLSTCYIGLATAAKWQIHSRVEPRLTQQQIQASQWMTQNTPFNILLWRVLVMDADGQSIWEGHISLLDGDQSTPLVQRPRQDLPAMVAENRWEVQRLQWFSKGYYTVESRKDRFIFYDLRFGFAGRYFFGYEIAHINQGDTVPTSVRQIERPDVDPGHLRYLWQRIWSPQVSVPAAVRSQTAAAAKPAVN